MRFSAVSVLCVVLAACAAAPVPAPPPQALFNDQLFRAPSERISAADVFALSDEMRHYLKVEIAGQLRSKGTRQGLIDALYSKGELKLEYDTVMTRNAAQAFAARSGNCLSLVIMTAAMAKELWLPVRYQSAFAEETLSRKGDVVFFIGHVNLTLGEKLSDYRGGRIGSDLLTIDFLPAQEIRGLKTRLIGEETIIAMYMNNRAAEAFAQGQLDDAYWWARAAIGQDPRFLSSYNTLGVVYHRHGNLPEAEKVLAYALEHEAQNTHIMSNLIGVLDDLGRTEEATVLARTLRQLEPNPPFRDFNAGLRAMREKDYQAARDLFAKEVDRAPYYDEFHFWLAAAYLGLGKMEQARQELALAMEYSTTRKDHDLYAAKLDRLKASQLQ